MDDRGHSGFTLVELLVTLAIAAILGGVAVPAMTRHLDRARLHAASEALVQELQQARNHAINYHRTIYFSWRADVLNWCFGWSDSAPCDCLEEPGDAVCGTGDRTGVQIHSRSGQEFSAVQLSTSRSGASRMLQFSPLRGTATATSFQLRSRHAQRKVIVSPLGRVRSCVPADAADPAC